VPPISVVIVRNWTSSGSTVLRSAAPIGGSDTMAT
jgi:hypothetical protein